VRPELVPGHNVDKLDIEAGLREAAEIGFDSVMAQMVTTYALQRWARGEEHGAIKTAQVVGGIDLTSFYRIVAAARAAASPVESAPVAPGAECNGLCLTGRALGIPSDAIAAAHPECAKHGHMAIFNIDGSPRT
jgi:hypothetical protein